MPIVNPLTQSFVPIAFMVGMSVATGLGILLISWLLSGRPSRAADTTYECGLDPMDPEWRPFPIRFHVVAMLFILFDVEVALLYTWAVYFGQVADTPGLRLFAFIALLLFVEVLVTGFVYLYKAGAFDWATAASRQGGASGRASGPGLAPARDVAGAGAGAAAAGAVPEGSAA